MDGAVFDAGRGGGKTGRCGGGRKLGTGTRRGCIPRSDITTGGRIGRVVRALRVVRMVHAVHLVRAVRTVRAVRAARPD